MPSGGTGHGSYEAHYNGCRRPQGHRRRIRRPRRRRGHGRPTTKRPERTPRPRRSRSGGAFLYPHVLSTNDSIIVTMSVRAHMGTDPNNRISPHTSAPVSRRPIVGLLAGHQGRLQRPPPAAGLRPVLDPPGHEPRPWQLSGKQETPVTHAHTGRQNPRKHPWTRPRSFRDDQLHRTKSTLGAGVESRTPQKCSHTDQAWPASSRRWPPDSSVKAERSSSAASTAATRLGVTATSVEVRMPPSR